ncbi:hypothetical protein QEX16_004978 [Salmonella enterica]|nr:hypothetical protein [Salmonella enterica]
MKRYFIKYEYGFVLLLAVYRSLYFINDKFLPDWPVVNMQGLRVQILAVTVSVVITLFFFFCYDTRKRREVMWVFITFMLSLHILRIPQTLIDSDAILQYSSLFAPGALFLL